MSISAVFAALLISAAVGLIGIGYTMWSYFSRQDYANKRMSDYSNYTAFDNTTVRGQEVLQLIESDLDVFVVIYGDTRTTPHSIDDMQAGSTPIAVSCPLTYDGFKCASNFSTSNSNVSCAAALSSYKRDFSGRSVWQWAGQTDGNTNTISPSNYKYKGYNKLFTAFTSKGLEMPAYDSAGNYIATNSFGAFKSVLIYDNDHTTDIVGVVLIRANEKCEL